MESVVPGRFTAFLLGGLVFCGMAQTAFAQSAGTELEQTGSNNSGSVVRENAAMANVFIKQSAGSDNVANITLKQIDPVVVAGITQQNATASRADITLAGLRGGGSYTVKFQDGTGNTATIGSRDSTNGAVLSELTGDNNSLLIDYQNVSEVHTTTKQSGSSNSIELTANNVQNVDARLDQTGSNNTFTATVNRAAGPITSTQSGEGNRMSYVSY